MDTTASTGDGIDCSPIVNINNDCLREIFKYLNVFDAVNAASTCKRLRCFANAHHYQKFIKFELKPDVKSKEKERLITEKCLRTVLQHFGNIIEEMDVHGATLTDLGGYHHLQCLLELCPNLHTLRIRNFKFSYQFDLFNVSSGIKVLEISECTGSYLRDISWTEMISNFHELRSLSITSKKNLGFFFGKLKNLNSLEMHDCNVIVWELENFSKNNGATMRKLKLMRCEALDDSVFPMITNKLPEIEELAIDISFVTHPDQLKCLAQLNHLKKLTIVFDKQYNIGTCMRLLGNRGQLELLDIYGGALDAETCGTLKNFQRLQTLRLLYPMSEDEFMMNIIADADLPELREFYCEACNSITNTNLVAMITSKRNLTTVDILFNKSVTFAAVRQIIDVLKSDLDGDRPHLNLNIDTIEMGEEEVKVLNANRHFVTVKNVTKSSKIEHSCSIFNTRDDSDDDTNDDSDDQDYRHPLFGYFDHEQYSNDNYGAFYKD